MRASVSSDRSAQRESPNFPSAALSNRDVHRAAPPAAGAGRYGVVVMIPPRKPRTFLSSPCDVGRVDAGLSVHRLLRPDVLPRLGHGSLHQEHEEHEPQAQDGEQPEDVEVGQGRRLLLTEVG